MSEQAAQLAGKFEAVNNQFINTVTGCSADQWQKTSASEGWSVGVIAHHAAGSHASFTGLLQAIASGKTDLPPVTMEMIHAGNAQHAKEFASVGQTETLEILQRDGETLGQSIRGLSDQQLSNTSDLFGGHEMTLAQITENIIIGHPAQHLESIKTTLNGKAAE